MDRGSGRRRARAGYFVRETGWTYVRVEDEPSRCCFKDYAGVSALSRPDNLAIFAGLCVRSPMVFSVPLPDDDNFLVSAPRDGRSGIVAGRLHEMKPKITKLLKKSEVPADQGGTSSIEGLHLAQAALEEAAFAVVAHERQGALVAGCGFH